MSQQWVLLRGANRRMQILVWALLIAIGLLIAHVCSPGTTASIVTAIINIIARLITYIGDTIHSFREYVHNFGYWAR